MEKSYRTYTHKMWMYECLGIQVFIQPKIRICDSSRGKVTEAVPRGKVAYKYYNTSVSAYMMIFDSDRSPLRKSSDFN